MANRWNSVLSRIHLATLLCICSTVYSDGAGQRNNVLFIIADDQRNNLGCYGDNVAITPNLDQLASEGVAFSRAYCQYAMCGPSRASLLTGLRPDSVKVYDLHTPVRKPTPGIVTLPQDFKRRGYYTQAIGKVFHPGVDDPESWSTATFDGPEIVGTTSVTSGTLGGPPDVTPGPGGGIRGPSWYDPDLPESKFHDGIVTNKAIKALGELKDRPFFLAVGYNRPHLPFVAPRKYFDMYRKAEPALMDYSTSAPENVPSIALTRFEELRRYRDIPATGPLSLQKARELTMAYYACTTFVDAQVGRLLAELKSHNLDDKTIVVFCGDHGFHLGDNSVWAKYTNFEAATRAPLIFRVPGGTTSTTRETVVEFVDVYATLADLCGWTPEAVDGRSLLDHLSGTTVPEPEMGAAVSQVNRGDGMGYSLRTHQYRYTEWRDKAGRIIERELYDYAVDSQELDNKADSPGMQSVMVSLHNNLEMLISKSH